MKRRIVATMLAFSLVLAVMPANALAEGAEGDGNNQTLENVAQTEGETQNFKGTGDAFVNTLVQDAGEGGNNPAEQQVKQTDGAETDPVTGSTTVSGQKPIAETAEPLAMMEEEPPAEGTDSKCGNGLTWEIKKDNPDDPDSKVTLCISSAEISGAKPPTGKMDDYSAGSAPWYDRRDEFTAVIIGDIVKNKDDKVVNNGVTSIGANAFSGCSNLKEITLPDSVTSIGANAFSDCSNLESIRLPDNANLVIGKDIFSGCSSLAGIKLPDLRALQANLDSIKDTLFGCSSLDRIELPDSMTYIDEGFAKDADIVREIIFEGSSSVTGLIVPETVTVIGDRAFAGYSLEWISLPSKLTSMGESVFSGCTSMTGLKLPNTNSIGANTLSGWNPDGGIWLEWPNLSSINKGFADSANVLKKIIFEGSVSNVKGLVVPEGVKTIEKEAFAGCSLEWVKLPDSLEKMEDFVFSGSKKLTRITLPENLGSIGKDSLSGCSTLTTLVLSNKVTYIDENTFKDKDGNDTAVHKIIFEGGSSVTALGLPDRAESKKGKLIAEGVGEIKDRAFAGSKLTSIILPGSLRKIGDSAFSDCSKLTGMKVPEGVTRIGDSVFSGCGGMTWIELPESVASIGNYAFSGCDSLTWIELPEGVASIGDYAFSGCGSLGEISLPESVASIGDYAFSGCGNLGEISLPDKVASIGDYVFSGSKKLTWIKLPANLASISKNTFSGGGDLGIELPDQVLTADGQLKDLTSIEQGFFDGYSGLTEILFKGSSSNVKGLILPGGADGKSRSKVSGVTRIGDKAFSGYSLEWIKFPASLTEIGAYAFSGSPAMTWIELPASVASVGKGAFSGCGSLAGIALSPSLASIEDDMFRDCASLAGIELPDSVGSVGKGAFSGCGSMTWIKLSTSLATIGEYAFSDCSSLAWIEVPEGVTSIGTGAFRGCGGLTGIKLPNGLTAIADSMFSGCASLKGMELPTSLISIGARAFSGCSGLEWITVPVTLAYVGEAAFEGCISLKNVYYAGSRSDWGKIKILGGNETLIAAAIEYRGGENPDTGDHNRIAVFGLLCLGSCIVGGLALWARRKSRQ